jgi:hypothetical protein
MIKTFTQNDLVDYIYQEQGNSSTELVIENSKQLNTLSSEISSMKQMLNQFEIKAPQRTIEVLLAYAKQQKQY